MADREVSAVPVESSSQGSVVSVSGVVGWEGGEEEEEAGRGAVSTGEGAGEEDRVVACEGDMASASFFSSLPWRIAGWEFIRTEAAPILDAEIVDFVLS